MFCNLQSELITIMRECRVETAFTGYGVQLRQYCLPAFLLRSRRYQFPDRFADEFTRFVAKQVASARFTRRIMPLMSMS